MITWHSTCLWRPIMLQFINFCKYLHYVPKWLIVRRSAALESRQRRHSRLQSCCQKRPEAQEEAGREEREGGVQEGPRRRRWAWSSVTLSDPAEVSNRNYSWLSNVDQFKFGLLQFAIATSEGVKEFSDSFFHGPFIELTLSPCCSQDSTVLVPTVASRPRSKDALTCCVSLFHFKSS